MTDFNNPEQSMADRLGEYGKVLQAHLDGTPSTDDQPTGMFLVGGATAPTVASAKRTAGPATAIVSIAAALLLLVGLVVPRLGTDTPNESITVNGGMVANQPEDPALPGTNGDDADAIAPEPGATKEAVKEEAKPAEADADDPAEQDWSKFTVATAPGTDSEQPASPDGKSDDTDSTATTGDAEKPEDVTFGEFAAEGGEAKADDEATDDKAEEDAKEEKPAGEDKAADEGKPEDDKPAEENPDDKASDEKSAECPDGAVVFAGECYLVVPPTCGDLDAAPTGDGCLKLVGSPASQSGCPGAYKLEGDTCVKLLAANVQCAEGTPVDGSCLIKTEATATETGCGAGKVQFGNGCYELTAPLSAGCGELQTLANGLCRYPVNGESATTCPDGFDPLGGDSCYRYEAPPTFTCAVGEFVGNACKSFEPGTPGPDVCGDGVQQDAGGCYILVAPAEDGSCGTYPEQDGQCRKDKPSYPTWTCPNGETVSENSCYVYSEATATCAAGELSGDNCKSIVAAIATTGCPDWAFEDGQGCYKEKPASSVDCGGLAVAPDGQNCKLWVGDANSGGGECPAGFDLVGSYCKKYVAGGEASCSGSELVTVSGKAMCRYTQPAGPDATGCGAGEVEKQGNCYLVVPATCGDLETDIYGTGCKQPIKTS